MRRFIVLFCVFTGALVVPSAASAAGEVHPGVQTVTQGAQCTANFIFRDASATYIGQAAHCSGTGAATDTNGCTSQSLPIGTAVTIKGATRPGTLVYNSWITMQGKGETNPDACDYNDLALVKVDPADVSRVDPSVPGFGGPTGVAEAPTSAGASVYSYGNSSLRGGVTKLSPKQGSVVQAQGNGWSRDVYTVTPGIPGDSGSGFLDASGNAIGVLSTVQIAPLAASNGVGDLAREIAYMQANSSFTTTTVVPGTKPFNPDLVGAIAGA
jgi:hypothetical protein